MIEIRCENTTLRSIRTKANVAGHCSTDNSSNASIGISFGLGGQQNGFTLELTAAKAERKSNGDSATNQNTQIAAANTLIMESGRDTNLRGAQFKGDTIKANVGRHLNIASVQDTDTFHSKENSSGLSASLCIAHCYGTTVSGAVSASRINVSDSELILTPLIRAPLRPTSMP